MGPSMWIGAWAVSSLCRLGDRATLCRSHGGPHSWPVYCNEFLSSHWPAANVGRHNCECHADDQLNLLCNWLWIVPYWGMPQTAGCRLPNTRLAGVKSIIS
jgi:hypothetical protein